MVNEITLVNKSTNASILINKSESQFVLDEVDFGTVGATHYTSKYPEQIGCSNTLSTLEDREISVTGWIIGESELDIGISKSLLNKSINPLNEIELYYDGYLLKFKPKNTIKYSTNYEENNEVLCKFLISGKCFNPLFADEQSTTIPMADEIGMFHFPLEIPETGLIMSYRIPSSNVNLINNGQVMTGFVIKFKANGNVKNPKIINIDTQEFILLNKMLEAGEEVIINTNDGEESVKGYIDSNEYNYFRYLDIYSSWMQLLSGDNIITYGADENVDLLDVEVEYSSKYLEVQ